MKKINTKNVLRSLFCLSLAVVMFISTMPLVLATDEDVIRKYDYTIENPYKDVDWDSWKPYRMATHVHTVRSDGNVEIDDMLEEYYKLGYQGVALTDHGTVDYGWTSKQSRLALYAYQSFVHGALDPLTAQRAEQMHTGSDRGGDGMTEIPMGIELNGASTNKCHINSYFADCGHGDMEISTTWPRTAVEKSHKAGGITHINHVGEWAEAKNDISVYNETFINDFASIYMDYSSCVGMELVNTTDNRTRNDRYLYDEVLKVLAPQGRNIFGFCEDDSHDYSDCANNAQFFMMPENNADNVRVSMETGAFFACSKNAKTPDELGDGFVASGDFPMVSRLDVNNSTDTISITPYNATVVKIVADGVVIDEKTVTADNQKLSFDLNNYENSINDYVRFYVMGPGGICYIQPFLLTKTENTTAKAQFVLPSADASLVLYDEKGFEVKGESKTSFLLREGDYSYVASCKGYESTTGTFSITDADVSQSKTKIFDIKLVPIVLTPKDDAFTVVDRDNGYIYGVRPGINSLDGFVNLVSGGSIEYIETKNGFGTGTKAVVKHADASDKTYTIVIFGDVNGDGYYDGQDAFMVSLISSGVFTKEQIGKDAYFAADCNHDGRIDETDVAILEKAGTLLSEVEQSSISYETVALNEEYLGLIDQTPDTSNETDTNTETDNQSNEDTVKNILDTIKEIIKKIFEFIKSVVESII